MTYLLFFLSIISLSTASSFVRWSQLPPEVLGSWRLCGAGLVLFLFAFKNMNILQLFQAKNSSRNWLFWSSLFFFTHQWTYYIAAQTTKISYAMIIFSTNPIFAAIAAKYLFKEKLSWKWGFSYILAFAGVSILVSTKESSHDITSLGNWSALLSAALYAGYIVTGKKVRETTGNLSYASIVYLFSGCCFLLISFIRGIELMPSTEQNWMGIIATILIPTFLGHSLFTYLVKRMDVSLLTCGKLLEPPLSTIPAFFLFNDIPNSDAYKAFALTSIAILILFFPFKRKRNFSQNNRTRSS